MGPSKIQLQKIKLYDYSQLKVLDEEKSSEDEYDNDKFDDEPEVIKDSKMSLKHS